MDLRVVQIGNSGGILIPKQTRRELGIRIGENVYGQLKDKKLIITNPKATKETKSGVDAKFAKVIEEFMDEHKDVLRELAKR